MAVIGGGVSGLPAIKCCRDEGLDIVCFEKRKDLGGLWNDTKIVEPGQSNVIRSEVPTLITRSAGTLQTSDEYAATWQTELTIQLAR